MGAVGLGAGEDVPDRYEEGVFDRDERAHRAAASGESVVAVLDAEHGNPHIVDKSDTASPDPICPWALRIVA